MTAWKLKFEIMQAIEQMNVGLSKDLLREIVEVIQKHANPLRIILFGSRARGGYQMTSDIDIAIDCGERDFLLQPIEEELRTLLKLDVVNFRRAGVNFQSEIASDGVILYESKRDMM
jgi:predicted nucleotidyltransferase